MKANVETFASAEAEAAKSRLLGVYPQKQEGLFMQRVKIFGGRITPHQWRTVARLAAFYTPQIPLHLTTRQDIEFHNVLSKDLAALQQALAAAGLSTLAAGGDSVRNITVCTNCRSKNADNLYELAGSVKQQLEAEPSTFSLPRKFKMSFSGCPKACAKPFINDLGFVLQENGLFTVIGAGSLGPKPAVGIELYKDLPADDVLPLCKASLQFFDEQGDRQNRRRARFRHIRERLGDEIFKKELDKRFAILRSMSNKKTIIKNINQELKRIMLLQLPNGDISSEDALLLADFAESAGIELRINLMHGLELYGDCGSALQLPPNLAALTNLPTIVACPGCRTCPNALTDCCSTAQKLRKSLQNTNSARCIHISGCPNDCAQCAVADIGLVGIIRTIEGIRTRCYRVLTGGSSGSTAALAKETAVLPAESVPQYIRKIL
jgi:sulfite reductase (ferredoxin)